jgi:hypothetical protein
MKPPELRKPKVWMHAESGDLIVVQYMYFVGWWYQHNDGSLSGYTPHGFIDDINYIDLGEL